MRLNKRAMAITGGVLWGGAVLCTGAANLARPRYGRDFLGMLASIYPGYHARPSMRNVAVGTAYALADGAIAGALVASLYNRVNRTKGLRRLAAA